MPQVVPTPQSEDEIAMQTIYIKRTTGAPVNGGSGTYAGVAPAGALLVNTFAGEVKLYINTNTKASPTWTVVGAQT